MLSNAFEVLSLIVVYGLACGQLVDTWLNGSIFVKPRAFFERLKSIRIVGLLGELMLCPRCFMHWVGAAATAHFVCMFQLPLVAAPVIWLAIVGIGQLTFKKLTSAEDELMAAAAQNDTEREQDV